jgi:GNAT superfamily N-acetyltransferase
MTAKKEDLQIRLATPDDVHTIMKLAVLGCEEAGISNLNQMMLLEDVWPALNVDGGLVGVIGKPDGEIEGFVLLRTGTRWYSNNLIIEEKLIFVHPDYRNAKGGRARRLCEFSQKAADALGLPLIIGVLSDIRTEAKIRMYERQFGKQTGAYWVYTPKPKEALEDEALDGH